MLVLGKDIEDVFNKNVLLTLLLRQDAHDCQERVPLKIFLSK